MSPGCQCQPRATWLESTDSMLKMAQQGTLVMVSKSAVRDFCIFEARLSCCGSGFSQTSTSQEGTAF